MASREKILTGFGLGEIPLAEKGESGPKVEFDSRKEFFATYSRYAQDPSIHVEYIPAIKTTDEVLDDGTFWRKRDVIGGVLKRDGVAVLAFRDEEDKAPASTSDTKHDVIYVKDGVLYDPKKHGPLRADEFKINGVLMYDFTKHNRYQALLEAGKLTPDEVRLLTNNSPLPLSG